MITRILSSTIFIISLSSLVGFAAALVYIYVPAKYAIDGKEPNNRRILVDTAGVIFAMSGARKYSGLDIYQDPEIYSPHSYESILTLYSLVNPGDTKTPAGQVVKVTGNKVEFDPHRLEYVYPRQSYDIPLEDNSVDFVFPHSVLEHVADPLKTIQAVHRVLRKRGVTAHSIDLRDHKRFF